MRTFRYLPLLALMATGCFDMDKQTFVAVLDLEKDEAHVLLVYEDIKVADSKEDDIKAAKQCFDFFFLKRAAFYAGHPMLLMPLEQLDPDEKESDKNKAMREFLKRHIDIKKTAWYLNKDKQLCGVQTLHIRELKLFVAGINDRISEDVAANAEKRLQRADKLPPEEQELLKLWSKAARDKHPWVKVESGRVSLSLVGTPAHFAKAKKELAEGIFLRQLRGLLDSKDHQEVPDRKDEKRDPDKPPKPRNPADIIAEARAHLPYVERLAAFVEQTPWSIEQRKNLLVVGLGLGDNEPIRFFSPYMGGGPKAVREPLIDHARASKVEQLKDAMTETIIAEFLKKHAAKK